MAVKKRKHRSVPRQVIVEVGCYCEGDHLELHTSADKCYLLTDEFKTRYRSDEDPLPPEGSLVVLECTWERPDWYDTPYYDNEISPKATSMYGYTGMRSTIYTWRIVEDE